MKIAVIAAMDKEVALLKGLMEDLRESSDDGGVCYEGRISGHDVVLTKCGIGKVNSALKTYKLVQRWHPEVVINSGVAGGADSCAPIGTTLIADGVGYHDVWCGPGTVPGQVDGYPAIFKPYPRGMGIAEEIKRGDSGVQIGTIASGDSFITTPEEIRKIKEIYPTAMACDMESASIAHACAECGVPFMVVRVVSDMPGGDDNVKDYTDFWKTAPTKTFETLKSLLAKL